MRKDIAELNRKLESGLKFLENQVSEAMKLEPTDSMREEYALSIATRLRTLLYDYPSGKGKSLLTTLGLRDSMYFISGPEGLLDAVNMIFTCKHLKVDTDGETCFCKAGEVRYSQYLYRFRNWWTEVVIDSKHRVLSHISRRDVVLVLADKEGGAHVDEEYDEAYRQVKQENGFVMRDGNGNEVPIQNDIFVEELLYIAQEFLFSYRFTQSLARAQRQKSDRQIIRLTYFRNNHWDYRNRYVGYRPHMADLQYCFDFYQKAMYEIMDLYELRGKKPDGSQYLYYVIDDSCAKIQFVHLRPQDGGCKMVLAREKNKYKIIENVEDVRAKKELHTLDECKAIANPENPHDFDYWLERSWLGNN